MHCANLYFPFGRSVEGLILLAGFLRSYVAPDVQSVDSLELEYAEEGDLHPSSLLGELGGSRGSWQTSPDLAFLVNQGQGLVLTENKLVEHSFYRCSARRGYDTSERAGNPDPDRCEHALAVLEDPESQCHQVVWGAEILGTRWASYEPRDDVYSRVLSGGPCWLSTLSPTSLGGGNRLLRQVRLCSVLRGGGRAERSASGLSQGNRCSESLRLGQSLPRKGEFRCFQPPTVG